MYVDGVSFVQWYGVGLIMMKYIQVGRAGVRRGDKNSFASKLRASLGGQILSQTGGKIGTTDG